MLKRLYIKNYVLIKELEILFAEGLSVITGETGAGKSILLDALSLLLGERADYKSILSLEEKCIVEADFNIEGNSFAKEWLENENLDESNIVTLRREIQPQSNKSRAFINDTPVTLQQLQVFSSFLVDVHRQFDSMQVFQKYFQVSMIDALAGNQSLMKTYLQQYILWKEKTQQLETLKQQVAQQKSELEYIQFLYDELEKANFQPQEIETLESEIKQLENAERFQNIIFQGQQILNEGDGNIIYQLTQFTNQVEHLKDIFPELKDIQQRLLSTKIELQDMYDEIARLGDHLKYDAQQVEELQNRLSLGFQLLKKHKVQTTNQLLELKDTFSQKLDTIVNADSHIANLEKEVQQAEQLMLQQAEQLSRKRQEKKPYFEQKINAMFQDVGMPNAKIHLQIKPQSPNEYGIDDIEILFDSNGSGRFESIRKVASGGEMSRLMLCLKFLIADYMVLPTMIFDEIDSGISGEVCKQVGKILQTLSVNKQIICVTHQPQIAAKGNAHFWVYKETENNAVHTYIKPLTHDERIKAIAEMISGENLTDVALQHAKEMMKS